MELIDRIFYQLSRDEAMVAITADYPGLLPTSQVSETRGPTFEKYPFPRTSPTVSVRCLTGEVLRTPCRARGELPTRVTEARQAEKESGSDRDAGAEV